MDYTIYYIGIPIVVVIAIAGWILYKRWQQSHDDPFKQIPVIPAGWQFFANPTNGEAPGTVFRITPQNQRFIVTEQKVPLHSSTEIPAKKTQKIDVSTGMLVKIAGINLEAGLVGNQKEEIAFEMGDCQKLATNDDEIDNIIKEKMANVTIRDTDRYFVIRETNATKSIVLKIKKELVERLGGKAKVQEKIEADSTVFSQNNQSYYDLDRTFPEFMRVMFNAEEIKVTQPPAPAVTKGPRAIQPLKFTRAPINTRLEYTEGQT